MSTNESIETVRDLRQYVAAAIEEHAGSGRLVAMFAPQELALQLFRVPVAEETWDGTLRCAVEVFRFGRPTGLPLDELVWNAAGEFLRMRGLAATPSVVGAYLSVLLKAIPFAARLTQQLGGRDAPFDPEAAATVDAGVSAAVPTDRGGSAGGFLKAGLTQRLLGIPGVRNLGVENPVPYYLIDPSATAPAVELRVTGGKAPYRAWSSLEEFVAMALPDSGLAAYLSADRVRREELAGLEARMGAVLARTVPDGRVRDALHQAVWTNREEAVELCDATASHRQAYARLVLAPCSGEPLCPPCPTAYLELLMGEPEFVLEWDDRFFYIPPCRIASRLRVRDGTAILCKPVVQSVYHPWVHPYTGALCNDACGQGQRIHEGGNTLPAASADAAAFFGRLQFRKGCWQERDVCIEGQDETLSGLATALCGEVSRHGTGKANLLGALIKSSDLVRTCLLAGHRRNALRPRAAFEDLPFPVPFLLLRMSKTLSRRVFTASGVPWQVFNPRRSRPQIQPVEDRDDDLPF